MSEPLDPEVNSGGATEGAPAPTAAAHTELRTFMIADIRGYTTYTREHGDEAGAALAGRFGDLVADVVNQHEGYLLELRGDEALVAFVSARKALRASVDLQARISEDGLPRGVGIGLDAGEAIPVGSGFRGSALNLAARLCAQASAGETLASEAVIHLAAKMDGIAYVDARQLKLKGYGDTVRAVVVVPSDKAKGRRLASDHAGSGFGRRRTALAAIVALVVVAIGASALGALLRTGGQSTPAPTNLPTSIANTSPSPTAATTAIASPSASPDPLGAASLPLLAFYDAATDRLKGTLPIKSPRNISTYAGGSFWILTENPRQFHRIDPQTNQDVQQINVPIDEPIGYAVDNDYIWVTDLAGPDVVRIDERSGTQTKIELGVDAKDTVSPFDVAVGDGSAWVSRHDVPEIVRVDRVTGEIQQRLPIQADGMAFGAGALWYWNGGSIGRVDPATNQQTFDPVQLTTEAGLGNIYFAGDDAWTTSADTGTVYRVDRSGRYSTYTLDPGVGEMAPTPTTMWVTNANTGILTGIDVATGQQNRQIATGHAVIASSASTDEVMLAVGPTVDEAIAALPGSVLKLATQGFVWWPPDGADPAVTGNWQAQQLMYLTCANLMSYRDKAGADGLALIPDAAEAPPIVSPDGRTYTFTIRAGLKFSPPSNEAVTADTFRHTLERLLSPAYADNFPGPSTFGDIVGAAGYRAGTAPTVSGLVVNGNQLSISLIAPAPDILDRLASPLACPVPIAGTPALRSGLNPDPPLSGAGPYYMAKTIRKQLAVFEKNPNYPGPRPQPFDEIAVRLQAAPTTALSMIQNGTVDGVMFDGGDPMSDAQSALATEWGPGSDHAAAGDHSWFGGPRVWQDYLALNPARPAFSDTETRHAVALAIDRATLASIWADAPTAQLLIPSVRGTDGAIVAPAPDINAAKALMKGRSINVTLLGYPLDWDCGPCRDLEVELTRELKAIGINVSVRHPAADNYPGDGVFDPTSDIDIVSWHSGGPSADPVTALGGLHDIGWLGKATFDPLDGLASASGQDRVDGITALAHSLTDEQFLVVPYGYPVFPFFSSERIGCTFVQQAIGAVDLLSPCFKPIATPSGSAAPSP